MTGPEPAEDSDDASHDADDAPYDGQVLFDLLDSTKAVLFDFDGPVCDLFGGASTASVAAEVKEAARQAWGVLDPEVEACDDSHGILRRLRDVYDRPAARSLGRDPLDQAELIVARQELGAVEKAAETPHVGTLLGLLHELGIRMVIVSNNAERPIREYLRRHGLEERFGHVFGRDPDNAGLMKPDPDCVRRALKYLDVPAGSCLFVGDQPSDLEAARSADTCLPFLGYTRDRAKASDMAANRANAVVDSYLPVIGAAEKVRKARWASRHQVG
ncbi:HAD-IA family hydrolase [Streptomyces sp. NPDC046862]|uniref:HAD family hydrolase n=1 Tax=Streptomyces sp. NPDC046862 TaxID=3154603 RepID=UPI003453A849